MELWGSLEIPGAWLAIVLSNQRQITDCVEKKPQKEWVRKKPSVMSSRAELPLLRFLLWSLTLLIGSGPSEVFSLHTSHFHMQCTLAIPYVFTKEKKLRRGGGQVKSWFKGPDGEKKGGGQPKEKLIYKNISGPPFKKRERLVVLIYFTFISDE